MYNQTKIYEKIYFTNKYNEKFLLKNHKTCNLSKINYVAPRTTPII